MGKGTHFFGQPIMGQLLNYLTKAKILQISRDGGGEKYYIDVMGFLEHPEKDWEVAVEEAISSPPVTE